MVTEALSTDYINRAEKLDDGIERYLKYLESEGKTPGGVMRTRECLDAFFRYCPDEELSSEQILKAKNELVSYGYVPKLTKEIIRNGCKYQKYRYGTDFYREIYPKKNLQWYRVPETDFSFAQEMDSFRKFIDNEPMNEVSKKRAVNYAEKTLRILCYEKQIRTAEDIDASCFIVLEKYLKDSQYSLRHEAMFALNRFVKYTTGKEPIREYHRKRDARNGFELTPQWARMMQGLDDLLGDLRERGYTDYARKNLKTNTVSGIRRLFGLFGPLYPEEIDVHHMREFRNRSTDIKDRTIKIMLNHIGQLVEFITGANPNKGARIMWSKQSVERTWIFKDETMFESATYAERVALVLCAGLGLRRNEIATLKLTDFRNNILTIRGKGRGRGKIVEKEVPHSVLNVIDDYLPERSMLLRKYGNRYGDSLLVPPYYSTGENTLHRYVGELVSGAAARVGIKATCHTLRRFYCMNLLDNGFELDTVRRMMRHSSSETTLECYVHADPRKLAVATASVDDALFG